jgi:hypothetical protein
MADLNGLLTLMGLSFDINDESFLSLFFGQLEGLERLSASLTRILNELQSRGFCEAASLLEVERFLDHWAPLNQSRSYLDRYSGHLGVVVSKLIGVFGEQFEILELINNEFSEIKINCEFAVKLSDWLRAIMADDLILLLGREQDKCLYACRLAKKVQRIDHDLFSVKFTEVST